MRALLSRYPHVRSNPTTSKPTSSSKALPRNNQPSRQPRRAHNRLRTPTRHATSIKRRTAIIRQLPPRARKNRARRHRTRTHQAEVLHGAEALAGCEREAGSGSGGGEAGTCAGRVPCAAADDAAV